MSGSPHATRWFVPAPAWSLLGSVILGVVIAGVQLLQDGALLRPSQLAVQASYPLLWWLLAPCIGRIDEALHSRSSWVTQVVLHASGGTVLGALHAALSWLIGALAGTLSSGALARGPAALAVAWWPLNLLVYSVILGAYIALRYSRALRLREMQASQLEADLATARLQALRMQLNPHFLFNTMNTIAMLVRARENDRAVQMLAGFSDLLRGVLVGQDGDLTRLVDEVQLVERYLAIERVRFADRLDVAIDVPVPLRDVEVPALLLQPLVENAIRHGISRHAGGGSIRVAARQFDGMLEVEVSNEGHGQEEAAQRGTGLGLPTTRERLQRRYGDRGQLEFVRTATGAIVRARLPISGNVA